MWIWAPPECALDENDDPQKEDFFIAAQSFEFIFEEPRPPANYDTGFNYIIEKNETTVSDISKGTRSFPVGCVPTAEVASTPRRRGSPGYPTYLPPGNPTPG